MGRLVTITNGCQPSRERQRHRLLVRKVWWWRGEFPFCMQTFEFWIESGYGTMFKNSAKVQLEEFTALIASNNKINSFFNLNKLAPSLGGNWASINLTHMHICHCTIYSILEHCARVKRGRRLLRFERLIGTSKKLTHFHRVCSEKSKIKSSQGGR